MSTSTAYIIEWDIPNWSQVLPFWEPFLPEVRSDLRILTIGERLINFGVWAVIENFR